MKLAGDPHVGRSVEIPGSNCSSNFNRPVKTYRFLANCKEKNPGFRPVIMIPTTGKGLSPKSLVASRPLDKNMCARAVQWRRAGRRRRQGSHRDVPTPGCRKATVSSRSAERPHAPTRRTNWPKALHSFVLPRLCSFPSITLYAPHYPPTVALGKQASNRCDFLNFLSIPLFWYRECPRLFIKMNKITSNDFRKGV
jgi:hypothetical protein